MGVRHEVDQLGLAAGHPVDLQGDNGAHLLDPGGHAQRSVLVSIFRPGQDLGETQVRLGLGNRSAADSVQYQFVEELIGGGQFFARVAPVLFTSCTTASIA